MISERDAARRLMILLALKDHAVRLMLIWDFAFLARDSFERLTGQTPRWKTLGIRGESLKFRAKWNWVWECRSIRNSLRVTGLSEYLSRKEHEFLNLGLSQPSRDTANQVLWQVEAAACIAWVLRLLPRLWPMDEQFDGRMDADACLHLNDASPTRQN